MGPDDTEQDALNEANLLGEASFDHFWAGSALILLIKMVHNEPELLENLVIVDERGKYHTLVEFFEQIKPLKVLIK